MTVDEALAAAESWVAIPDPNECARLLAREVRTLRAELARERARRTLGGVPPGYHLPGAWANQPLAPPASANDPGAPPLVTDRSSRHAPAEPNGRNDTEEA
ncbi:hypothetical protein Psed_5766 [Pseudonocardia dioxanivorans CB1190]|uniref:Uncharacterized protein n=1 Tax=Pseudonocardia dioxanivorans (strain ATCC 55486 / DSM 44775 / JCM 13855 / CB1190) TaxID=675635 RepID=F4D1A5_PSEUX|nr:hypothetical protein [Pseudonocardia dioxanivorans]AEA27893.1 hypothetical protein Psed_5766 [Pseudonocardia dioxanivorans CB1190]